MEKYLELLKQLREHFKTLSFKETMETNAGLRNQIIDEFDKVQKEYEIISEIFKES
jgi:hypothetical protein